MKNTSDVDNRMEWIRMFEKNNILKEFNYIDYEVCSEKKITGILQYDNGNLKCRQLSKKDQNGLYSYIIRIKFYSEVIDEDKLLEQINPKGYFFQGGLIGEILGILSLYFQCRFYLKSESRLEEFPERYNNVFLHNHASFCDNYEMFSDEFERRWSEDELVVFLDNLKKIPPKNSQQLSYALYWYLEALKEIGGDRQLFYIKMVSAVECISSDEIIKDDLYEKMINYIASSECIFISSEIAEIKLLFENRKTKFKFGIFLQNFGGLDDYKQIPENFERWCITSEEEKSRYIKKIYDARSKYLHRGIPLDISSDIENSLSGENFEYLRDVDFHKDKNRLPRTRWFERLVNKALKNYVSYLIANIPS